MKVKTLIRTCQLVAGALLLAPLTTQALYWDRNGTTAGSGGPSPSGTWSTSAANWNSDAGGGAGTMQAWPAGGNSPIFSAGTDATGPYTVTISGTLNVNDIAVEEGSVQFNTGTITMNDAGGKNGTARFTVNPGASASWAPPSGGLMAGSKGLNKLGGGSLDLGGGETYTGNTYIDAGTCYTRANPTQSPFGNSGASATLSLTNGSAILANASNAGDGNAYLRPGYTISLSTGGTGGGVLGALSGFGLQVGGQVTGAGSLTVNQPGTLILTNLGNNYSGGTSVSGGGALAIAGDGSLGAVPGSPAVNLTLSGGMLKDASTSPVLHANRTISLGASGGNINANFGQTLTINGKITGAGALNVNYNLGTVVFANTGNDYSGTLTIGTTYFLSAAVLQLGASNVLPDGSGKGDVAINSGGSLVLNGFNETINGLSGAGAVNNGAASTTSTFTVGNNGQTSTFDGVIQDGAAGTLALTKTGSGTLTLTGPNTYSGTTTVSGGTLSLTTGSIGNSTAINISSGTLSLGGNNKLSDGATVTVSGSGILNLNANTDTVGTFNLSAGSLNGSGKLTATTYGLSGGTVNANLGSGTINVTSGTVTLNGTEDATAVNINSGSLSLGGANRLADGATITVSGGSLNLNGNSDTVGTFNLSAGSLGGSGTLTATTYGLSGGTVNANLGGGTVNVSSSTVTLNGTEAATTVNINSGSLSLGGANKLADGATVTVAGGSLNLNGNSDTVDTLNLSSGSLDGSGTLTAGTYSLSGGTVNANLGTGTLNSSGTVALNGTTAAGTVNVTAGTLTLGAANRLGDSGAVNVSGGTLAMSGNNDTVGAVTLSSGAAITGSGGTLSGSSYDLQSGSVSAKLGGSANLSKSTGGMVALSGANTYSGTTTVSAGTLLVNGSIGNGAVTVSGGVLGGSGTIGGNITVQSGGTLAPGSSIGTLMASGNVTLNSGSTTVMEVNRGATPNTDKVQGIGTLTQGGTLSVINNGAALQVNDSFTLFSATTYNGQYAAISPANPNSDPDLAWDQPALKNTGVLKVHHVPSAVDTNITRAKGISFKLRLSDLFPATDAVDGDSVVLAGFTAGSQGATINTNATYLFYTPANDNNDAFNYTVTDNRGGIRAKTITINVGNYSTGTVTITNNGAGSMTITFYGIPNYEYVIQRSPDVAAWTDVATNSAAADGVIQYTESPPYSPVFYRVRTP